MDASREFSEEDFFQNIDFTFKQATQGKLLISEPFLFDPNFKRTVVLLAEHNEEGSVGFILNRPIEVSVAEALDDFPDFDSNLFFGGPVGQNNLFYIHTLGDKLTGSKEIIKGIFWGGDFEHLKLMIDAGQVDPKQIQFFAGYSGWAPEQLDRELKEKSWIVADTRAEQVMKGRNKEFWSEVLKDLGNKFAIMANFPEDPSLN